MINFVSGFVRYFLNNRIILNFIIAGVLAFTAYFLSDGLALTFMFMGPPIYIANFLKATFSSRITFFPWNNEFFFLLPVCLTYYSILGLQFHHLNMEKGILKHGCILAMIAFMIFIHYTSWTNLGLYYLPRY